MKSSTCFTQTESRSPLSEYYSFDEAEQAAKYINHEYGRDLVPYQCKKCFSWHLSPRRNCTPSKTCKYCTDSNGEYKQLYFSQSDAQRRADIIGKLLNVYPCRHQTGWHLTKGRG